MTANVEITIYYSTEGFLGSESAEAQGIDFDASCAAYERQTIAAVHASYPEADVSVIGPAPTLKHVEVTMDIDRPEDYREEEDIQRDVENIDAQVYERGQFWIDAA